MEPALKARKPGQQCILLGQNLVLEFAIKNIATVSGNLLFSYGEFGDLKKKFCFHLSIVILISPGFELATNCTAPGLKDIDKG